MRHETLNHSVKPPEKGTLAKDLGSLNLYYAFMPNEQEVLLAGLVVAAEYAPTAQDLQDAEHKISLQYQNAALYEKIADSFATTIDRQYHPGRRYYNNPTTVEVRNIFLHMIQPHSRETIDEATKAILRQDREMKQVAAIQKASQPVDNPNVVNTVFLPKTGTYLSAKRIEK